MAATTTARKSAAQKAEGESTTPEQQAPAAEAPAQEVKEQEVTPEAGTEVKTEAVTEPAAEAKTEPEAKPEPTVAERRAQMLQVALAEAKRGAEAPQARTKKLGYGVFETPDGHLIKVRYSDQGKAEGWELIAPDLTWVLRFNTKRDAIAWLDATGDLAAQAKAIAALRAKAEQK